MAPGVIVLSFFPNTYSSIYFLIRVWAYSVFYGIGMRYKLDAKLELTSKNYVIISNHTSVMDVMLMIILHKHHPLTFVGKKELVKIPLFGTAYKRICVMVDRKSARSKARVYELSVQKIHEGRSMVIFPEGGVTEAEDTLLLPFKDGAFTIAQKAEVPLVAYTFIGMKEAFPFEFWKGGPRTIDVYREKIWSEEELTGASSREISKEAYDLILSRIKKAQA